MHLNSMMLMEKFRDGYLDTNKNYKILDVGSLNVNPGRSSYKNIFTHDNWTYTGLDIQEGLNVDIVSKDLYNYPLSDNSFDIVISGQTIEHTKNLHLWVSELVRILSLNGLICIIGPNSFPYHAFPIDCWRVYPDGMNFLLSEIGGLKILDCYMGGIDTIGIARKEK